MTRRRVLSGDLEYDFAPDDAPPVIRHHWALATVQLLDEVTEDPLRVPFRVRVETARVTATTGADGTFCLVSRPGVRFPAAPGPRPQVRVRIFADGFLPFTADFTVGFDARSIAAPAPAAGTSIVTLNTSAGLLPGQVVVLGAASSEEFNRIQNLGPNADQVTLAAPLGMPHGVGEVFIPATPPTTVIPLRREPVTLRGRVVRLAAGGASPTPVANATIKLADYWRTQRDVRTRSFIGSVPVGAMTVPAPKVFVLGLVEGMLTARAVGAAAAGVILVPVVGDENQLVRAADAGQTSVRVSNRRNLTPGNLVRIDAGAREVSEIRTVGSVMGAGGSDDPATVALDQPLFRAHSDGVRVDRMLQPSGPSPLQLSSAAAVGDRSIFLDALPAVPGVRVQSPGITDEYHDCARYEATSDTEGYFRLPPIHRVAQVRLDVDDGATLTPAKFFVDPDYTAHEQWLDLRLE